MKIIEEIKELMREELSREEIAEILSEDMCMAEEFKEKFPNWCGENADCFDCWKQRVVRFIDEELEE